MPPAFLRDWFGTLTQPEVAEQQAAIRQVIEQNPTLAGPGRLLFDLVPLLLADPLPGDRPAISSEIVQQKLAGGIPLLQGESIRLDEAALGRRWQRVCDVAARHTQPDSVRELAQAQRQGRLSLGAWVQAVLAGQIGPIHSDAERLGLDAELAATLLRFTLFPTFVAWNQMLADLRRSAAWSCGYCPTCGSRPLLAEYRGLEQRRFLRCGLCAAEWPAERLFCPFCGNTDHRSLGYFHLEGQENQARVATCDRCHGHVKTVNSLGALSPMRLLIADLQTLPLDLAPR